MNAFVFKPDMPPPVRTVGALAWMRANLFSNWLNTLLTLFALYLVWLIAPPLLQWAIVDADWIGGSRADCSGQGACWVFVQQRFDQFLYGYYPTAQRWRVDLTVLSAVLGAAPLFLRRFPRKAGYALGFLLLYPLLAWCLLRGGVAGLPLVATSQWGGLMLTLVIATVGIAGALPLGILLALGRRSKMPAVKVVCVTFIEFWRGVPLITVLFMSSVMLPLFLPEGMSFDKLLRAMIGVILFQSAYIAEVVRGGLQAIPKGQYEAAAAMGLGYWRSMGLVILPQALKLVIPGIVNTFIALFKDTSLVVIIGLFDLLNSVKQAAADPAWLGMATEGYVFAALVYWVFCFGMSSYSRRLERRLDTGHKRQENE
ncbi:amino acid ABC transporter permease [Pseudomonas japonica]|uniref:Amino acid ABC transporter membrane protein 2, PAAT family n=1 Tax=Pseudomonas japonica TaxID=256466 RepID=A0A239JIN5_9PSED|nr:amino acid ABC transporter permease [Pseudomonas japonica]SNT05695.1 amino acid ABC transporter membrane protein 2, PAAT family [Pseudomonas japonica]